MNREFGKSPERISASVKLLLVRYGLKCCSAGKKLMEIPVSASYQFGASTYSLEFVSVNESTLQIKRRDTFDRRVSAQTTMLRSNRPRCNPANYIS